MLIDAVKVLEQDLQTRYACTPTDLKEMEGALLVAFTPKGDIHGGVTVKDGKWVPLKECPEGLDFDPPIEIEGVRSFSLIKKRTSPGHWCPCGRRRCWCP